MHLVASSCTQRLATLLGAGLQHAPGGWLATRSGTAAEPMGPGLCRMLDLDFREPLLGTWVNKVQASGVSEKLAMSVHRTSWDAFLAVTTGKGTRTVDNIYYGSCALTFEAAPSHSGTGAHVAAGAAVTRVRAQVEAFAPTVGQPWWAASPLRRDTWSCYESLSLGG